MLGVVVVYLGLITAFTGAVSLIGPLRFLAIRTRRRALLVVALGVGVVLIGAWLPATETRVTAPRTQLDEFVPVYQFSEFHSIRVAAPKEQVYRAIKSVTADDILFFRTLTWLRRFGRPLPESILNPGHQPIIDIATKTSFLVLAEEPNREIVLGTLVMAPRGWRPSAEATPERFKRFHAPGFALAAMNFRLEDAAGATPAASKVTIVTTETRIYATDPSAGRRFARYWRVIYPGSALLRRMWLRAIAHRAEAPPDRS
jgi:hypothetical protein